MLRVRMSDGPRKGQIVEVSCEAGWAMLKDGRATDPRTEVQPPPVIAEVKPVQQVQRARRGDRR